VAGSTGAAAVDVQPSAGSAQAAGGAGQPATGPVTTAQQAPAWTAVAACDRAYYESVIAAGGPDAATIEFPAYCPERRFQLAGKEMRIGRHSASRGLYPEIDLTGPPTDPGVSRLHAVLIAQPDGGWVVVDPGSENGTLVNSTEISSGTKVPLHDGDRIHLGAWTVITIHTG
jgi:FHA domain